MEAEPVCPAQGDPYSGQAENLPGIDKVGIWNVVELNDLVYRNSIPLGNSPEGISRLNSICFLYGSGAGYAEYLVYIN